MNTPTAEQIAKLPKWAQEHIGALQREAQRDRALAQRLVDHQTESPVHVPDYSLALHETKRYVNMGHSSELVIDHAKVHLRIRMVQHGDSQRDLGVELKWGETARGIDITGKVAMHPRGYNTVCIIHSDHITR